MTKEDSSEARKRAAVAISSARPKRPMGWRASSLPKAWGVPFNEGACEVGGDVAGADAVHPYAPLGVVDGEILGELYDPALEGT